ncbi:MAG: glycosyltransferase family 4 protein [Pseudomonadota bacterium]
MILVSAQAFPPATGGIENLLHGTALYAAKAGYRVVVFADGGTAARRHDATAGMPYATRRFTGPRPLRRWLKARALLAAARDNPIDALFLDTWKSLEPLPAGLPFPVVPWAHGNEFPPTPRKTARIRRALSKASHILVNSRETDDRLAPARPGHVPRSILHPPVFPAAAPDADDLAEASRLWGMSRPRLFSVCRLIDWKGIDQAIRALPAIRAVHPQARYVIAGGGGDRTRLEGIVREAGVAEAAIFTGRISPGLKTALMRSADLFLQPGRQVVEEREGYGITYAEAALEGLPTICGSAGGAPEAILPGKTGLVVDGTNVAAIAEAGLTLLSDPERLDAMKHAARAHGIASLWESRIGDLLAAAGLTTLT